MGVASLAFMAIGLTGCLTTSPDQQEDFALDTVSAPTPSLADPFAEMNPTIGPDSDILGRPIRYGERSLVEDWISASGTDTINAYRQFLDKHPGSRKSGEAERRLRALRFADTKERMTSEAFRDFLGDYFKGPDVDALKGALHYVLALEKDWEIASAVNTIQAYREYRTKYRRGDRAKEAEARILIYSFHEAFGRHEMITDEQSEAFLEKLENEAYSTSILEPLEYYESDGGNDYRKLIVDPAPGLKACVLRLEAANLSVNAIYVSSPFGFPVDRALFSQKWKPTVSHNGNGGPGLRVDLDQKYVRAFGEFLRTYNIEHKWIEINRGNLGGYAIPDLVWGIDERSEGLPHKGHNLRIENESGAFVPKVDGVQGRPEGRISGYHDALALKTYLKVFWPSGSDELMVQSEE